MSAPVIVLVGPHGAGKTTLGRLLAQRLGVPFEDEIGAELRRAALAADPTRHALLAQEDFDDEVMRRELARDEARDEARDHDAARVVETWHVGNVAYAARRSPDVARRYRERLTTHLEAWRPRVWVQPLTLEPATALARLSEPGPDRDTLLAFFRAVGKEAVQVSAALGLAVLPALATDDASPQLLAERVLAHVALRGARRELARRRTQGARDATSTRGTRKVA